MHIPDGFVSPAISLPAYALSIPLWGWAVRRYFGSNVIESLPLIGSLTALAFVVQTIMIPIPGGTSTHLVGIMLLALLYNPLVAFICESLVLLIQALFFGAGGITVLGVNALAMGLCGPLTGWLTWRLLRRYSPTGALFASGWVAIQISTVVVAAVLALQYRLDSYCFPLPPAVTFSAMLLPSLSLTGSIEGLYTVFTLTLLRKANVRGIQA